MNDTETTTKAAKHQVLTTQNAENIASAGSLSAAPLLMDIKLQVYVRMGHAQMSLQAITQLASGSLVELDCSVNDPVEIVVNDRVIAAGEIVIVEGNYGVRITRIEGSDTAQAGCGVESQLLQLSERLK